MKQVNFTKHISTSVSTSIRKFFYGTGKVLAIEQTVDTENLGKLIVIINNKDYPHTTKEIGELLAYLYKEKDTLPTMKSSLAKFNSYLEMNGGPPITESLSAQVVALELELESQPVPSIKTTIYSPSAAKQSIWEVRADLPQSITIITSPTVITPAAISYKSAVQNQPIHTS